MPPPRRGERQGKLRQQGEGESKKPGETSSCPSSLLKGAPVEREDDIQENRGERSVRELTYSVEQVRKWQSGMRYDRCLP